MVALVEQQGGVYCPDVLSARFYKIRQTKGPLAP